jgi:hypothetical protein
LQMVERHTRLPHDPEYTALLGAAVYAFAYTEWMLMEILRSLEPDATHASLAELTSGQVAAQLRTAIEKLPQEEGREIGKRFAALVERRNDMIHAHPATAADGAQRLSRWAPHKSRFALLSDAIVREFIADVEALSRDAQAVRVFVKSQAAGGG